MEKDKVEQGVFLLKCVFAAYLVTALSLMLLTFLVYKMGLPEKLVGVLIIGIYIGTCFLAGFLAGKGMRIKKFLYGLIAGCIYFVILAVISAIVNHSLQDMSAGVITTFILCAASGMLGGMVS